MTLRDVTALRLRHQQIEAGACQTPAEVVRHLGALQAQDYGGALWSIGLRLAAATVGDIERAIAQREIVRTWPMRGTLHVVPAADVRWMLRHLTPRIVASSKRRRDQLELTEKIIGLARDALLKALAGGKLLTRDGIFAVLRREGFTIDGQRGYHIIWRLAQEALICGGAREDGVPTFALLDEWVAPGKDWDREPALAELARRYFASHGPATDKDFAWWAGLTLKDARNAIALAGSNLERTEVGGKEYWMDERASNVGGHRRKVYLLPGFDEYMLGYQDRTAALDPRYAERIVPGNNGMFMPTVINRGQVIGTWKKVFKKGSMTIEATPFSATLAPPGGALSTAAKRFGNFLGMPVSSE